MIRIEPDARSEGDTGERHGDAALAGSRLGAPSWDGGERLHTPGRGERHQRGGRRREAAGAEARWRRIRSTSARSSARSASIRSSERISSTTAAGDTDARAAAGAWAAAAGAGGGSGATTDVTPR